MIQSSVLKKIKLCLLTFVAVLLLKLLLQLTGLIVFLNNKLNVDRSIFRKRFLFLNDNYSNENDVLSTNAIVR